MVKRKVKVKREKAKAKKIIKRPKSKIKSKARRRPAVILVCGILRSDSFLTRLAKSSLEDWMAKDLPKASPSASNMTH